MNAVLEEQCVEMAGTASRPPKLLFASSTLMTWSTETPERFARDFQINGTVYRRLDPQYYAWLRSRMVIAKKAAAAGQIDASAFEELRGRFNAVHEWAVGHFGEDRLLEGVRTLRAEYSPPVPEDDQPRLSLPQVRRSDQVSTDAVDGRRDRQAGAGRRLEPRTAVRSRQGPLRPAAWTRLLP